MSNKITVDNKLTNSSHYRNQGDEFFNQENYEDAIKAYTRALELDPDNDYLNRTKGDALFRIERYPEAIECYDTAIKRNPTNKYLHRTKGDALFRISRYQDAVKAYDRAIDLDPKNAYHHRTKGDALFRIGKYLDAVKAYDRAIELNPNNEYLYRTKEDALLRLNKYQEVIECNDKTINLDPTNSENRNKSEKPLGKLGNYSDAIEYYTKAIESGEKDLLNFYRRGICYINSKNEEKATEDFKKAREMIKSEEYQVDLSHEDVILLNGILDSIVKIQKISEDVNSIMPDLDAHKASFRFTISNTEDLNSQKYELLANLPLMLNKTSIQKTKKELDKLKKEFESQSRHVEQLLLQLSREQEQQKMQVRSKSPERPFSLSEDLSDDEDIKNEPSKEESKDISVVDILKEIDEPRIDNVRDRSNQAILPNNQINMSQGNAALLIDQLQQDLSRNARINISEDSNFVFNSFHNSTIP